MILALDFGTASIKAVLIDDLKRSRFISFNLGFRSPLFNRSSLLSTIRLAQDICQTKILEGEKPLARVIASVSLPVYENCEVLSDPVLLTGTVLSMAGLNILDVGAQFVHFNGRVSIAPVPSEEVLNWLPFKTEVTDISGYLENKRIYSSILPTSPRDLFFEHAIAKVKIREILRSQRIDASFNEIYLSGGVLSKAPFKEQAMMIALDGLEMEGVVKIWLDSNQLLPVTGLIKYYSPEDLKYLGDDLSPVLLGTLITFNESCEVDIDLGLKSHQKITLKKGEIYNFPLHLGEQATVSITNLERDTRKMSYDVTGGVIGLVFDLRGRPLILPESATLRQEELRAWDRQIGASGQIEKI